MPLVENPPRIPASHLELAFTREEYEARLAKVRQSMAEKGLDLLLVTYIHNACYLFGYQTPLANWYSCILLPLEGEPVAHVIDLEVANVVLHGWGNDDIYSDHWWTMGDAPAELVKILKQRGWAKKRIGLEMQREGCSAHLAQTLRAGLPDATFVDASSLVLDIRVVKSEAELDVMRRAARLSDIGMEAGLSAVQEGHTDNDVGAAAYEAMVRAGSEYVTIQPLLYSSESLRLGLTHLGVKRRVIQPGDVFTLELTGVYQRYSAPLYRTAVLGEPSDTIERLANASISTLDALFENARPGRPASEVARTMRDFCRDLVPGLPPRENFAYAVGIGFPPDWVEHSLFISTRHERPLEVGMVFHSPMAYRLPGTDHAAAFSETWMVTEDGGKALTSFDRDLVVIP